MPETRFADLTIAAFAERLGSAEPVPGGGSASAITASLGGALVAMVARLSEGRPKYAEHAELHAAAIEAGDALVSRLQALADDDASAYATFSAALKLPKDSDEERATRGTAMRAAARTASEIPLQALEACHEVATWAEALAGRSNRNASSDLEVASLLALAAGRGAAANVLVNLPSVGDEGWAGETILRVDELTDDLERLADATREVVRSGEPREPLPARSA